jgi:hypothetical protein
LILVRYCGSIWTAAAWPVPVVVTTVDCAKAPVDIRTAAAESRNNFFISFSSSEYAPQQPLIADSVPDAGN